MADITTDDSANIIHIMNPSSRLTFVLQEHFGVSIAEISSLRLDGDNNKVDVWVGERMLRFKAKGTQHVLATQPNGTMKMTLDPALAQTLYELVSDHAH